MTPKQAKRLKRLLESIDRVIGMMDESDLRPFVDDWNVGSRNLRLNLAEFVDWQTAKLTA